MTKDKIINFKIDEQTREAFNEYCEANFTTPSHELRLFVNQRVKHFKSKRISLQEFKARKS